MSILECVSYLGETDFSTHNIFLNSKIPVIYVSPKYPKETIGGQPVTRESKNCVEPYNSNKSKYSPKIKERKPSFILFITFICCS